MIAHICSKMPARKRVGPHPKNKWMILVDECRSCHRIMNAVHPITWEQYTWIRRWNRAMETK